MKRGVAITQISIGVILFVLTLTFGSILVEQMYINSLQTALEGTTKIWAETADESERSSSIDAHVISDVIQQGLIVKTTGWNFIMSLVILALLSIMFFLQGLANYR
jgi:hypothetical protein